MPLTFELSERSCTWPFVLKQVGMTLGSPYDWVVTGITYAYSGSRQTWYQSRTVCRTIKPWSMSNLAFYSHIVTWVYGNNVRHHFSPYLFDLSSESPSSCSMER